jgi:hypothetical protein
MEVGTLKNLDLRDTGRHFLPYLSLVAIHLISGLQMKQPLILMDELGYLGNARYLAGAAHLPDMWQAQFYHFGYSLFLLPAFWLLNEPVLIYKVAIFTNALLASSLFFPLYFILSSIVRVHERTARWVAFACCLYPPVILYSNFAWSENAFIPLYALAAALFGKYLASRSTRDALLFSFFAGFLYTIHPRALPVLVAVLSYLALLAILKTISARQLVLSASTIGAVFAVTRLVNEHLRTTGWAGGGGYSASKLAERLLPDADLVPLIERALGQVLYLSQASHGLFLLGLIAMIWIIVRGVGSGSIRQVVSEPGTGVPLFVLTTGFGVLAASCTLKLYSLYGENGMRGADFIHGRYNEAFAVIVIAFALAELRTNGIQKPQLLLRMIVVIAAMLSLTVVVMAEVDDAVVRHVADQPDQAPRQEILSSEVNAIEVAGVYPVVDRAGAMNLYLISAFAVLAFLIITSMMRISERGGMVLLMLLFSLFSYHNFRHYLMPAQAKFRPHLTFASHLRGLGPIAAISYDTARPERFLIGGIQYLMQDTVFDRFNSHTGEEPESEAVISDSDWAQADRLGARYVISSGTGNAALWFLPGELQSRLPVGSFDGMILGTEPIIGVQEFGFHQQEDFGGTPARWTKGTAELRVPLNPKSPPHVLGIETIAPGRESVDLRLLANGIELWHQPVLPEPWSGSFRLDRVPMDRELRIEILSDTYTPSEGSGRMGDQRHLGIVVRGIRLAARDRLAAEASAGMRMGAAEIFGVPESGFHQQEIFDGEPARWTDGAATLSVPLDPENPPELLEIRTVAPGRESVDLQLLANGFELWHQPVPPEPWSRSFRLDQVPMNDELLIEILSDTFTPRGGAEGSGDLRSLGVVVTGIRLAERGHLAEAAAAGMTLGAEPILGIPESGFYEQERFASAPSRWTNGAATLTVPLDPEKPPGTLVIETAAPGRDGAVLRVRVNGTELFHQRIPQHTVSQALDLGQVAQEDALFIELDSNTFVPGEVLEGSQDRRTLGVMVTGIRLLPTDTGLPPSPPRNPAK